MTTRTKRTATKSAPVKKRLPTAKPATKTARKAPPAPVARKPLAKKPAQTPLELARAARASGATSARKKPTKMTWQAPAEFVPALFEVQFKTEKDGLVGGMITCTRIQGTYDKAPPTKRRLVDKYDPKTLLGIAARLSAATYVSKVDNRLPANSQFRVLYRAGIKSADGSISVTVRNIWVAKKVRNVVQAVELPRNDPHFRRIRKSTQLLPAVFASSINPPVLARGKTEADYD